ncbi:hypothetical protein [Mucilaginibacter auburnensis]|uniref:Uncharacterized protein n=1 Tax=Mucilaginibacter auburnensis TaxID=1457233 RepID=A0A2H9VNZ0_9SPHI|nr:hypothetical protein [Mucilaginibacter auburnensis]PJJ80037.1 hypothetical protein CLV57_3181 [Mucilaginibacter auburnensis]
MIITIKDETFGGKILRELNVEFKTEIVTIRDIISARVLQEVEFYNNRMPDYFTGLVEPTEAEQTLNGYKVKYKKIIDAEKQVYVALAAFQSNGFFVLVDNMQSEGLEQKVELTDSTLISFIKLTPLVGG